MSLPAKTGVGPDRASGQPARPPAADGDPPAPSAVAAAGPATPAHDAVEVYGDDSFPASDPPGWWAGP